MGADVCLRTESPSSPLTQHQSAQSPAESATAQSPAESETDWVEIAAASDSIVREHQRELALQRRESWALAEIDRRMPCLQWYVDNVCNNPNLMSSFVDPIALGSIHHYQEWIELRNVLRGQYAAPTLLFFDPVFED